MYVVKEIFSTEWNGEMDAKVYLFNTLKDAQKHFNKRKKSLYKEFEINQYLEDGRGEIFENVENKRFDYRGEDGMNESRVILYIEKIELRG